MAQAALRLLTQRRMTPWAHCCRAWTPESDMYSFGVLMFEIYSFGEFPFALITDDAVFIQLLIDSKGGLLSDKLPLAKDAPVTPVVLELLRSCVDRSPDRRPTALAAAALTSPTFSEWGERQPAARAADAQGDDPGGYLQIGAVEPDCVEEPTHLESGREVGGISHRSRKGSVYEGFGEARPSGSAEA